MCSRDFLDFLFEAQGFLGFLIFPTFDHPHHLKSGEHQVPLPGENTFFAVFTFEASCASANVVFVGIPHVARSAVQAGLTGAKILLKETSVSMNFLLNQLLL